MTAGVSLDWDGCADRVGARCAVLGAPLFVLATTPSTNDEAKQGARRGAPHGATWVADEQTAGRGRQGRTWVAPRGQSVLVSVLVRAACPPARLPPVALFAGLAVRDAVAAVAPRACPTVKWPNDVVVGGRKIAGVLVEAMTAGSRVDAVVIGIGVNVHTREFPPELGGRATSIELVAEGAPVDRPGVLVEVLAALERDLNGVLTGGLRAVRARLEAADGLRGRRVATDTGDQGVASGIDDEGRLLVRRDDGALVRLVSGEVHLVAAEPR